MFHCLEFPIADAYVDADGLIVGTHWLVGKHQYLFNALAYLFGAAYPNRAIEETIKVLRYTTRADGHRSVVRGQIVFPPGVDVVVLQDVTSNRSRSIVRWSDAGVLDTLQRNTMVRRNVDPFSAAFDIPWSPLGITPRPVP